LFNTLTKEELGKFLNFFVKPIEKDAPKKSLIEFLDKSQIGSIQVNELRYELVSDDEVVVKSGVLEGADLKGEISKIVKQDPHLVRDVLLNKPLEQKSCKEKFGTEVNLDELTQGIEQQIKTLTDDEALALLASGLESTLRESDGENRSSTLNQVAGLLNKLLENREREKLLPEVKKMFSGHRVLEDKCLDFVFDERWLKSQAVLEELMEMVGQLGKQEVDLERFMFLLGRVIESEEEKIRLHLVDKLLSNLDSENDETRRLSVSALREILSRVISGKMEVEFVYLRDSLRERIKEERLAADILKDCTELVKMVFIEIIQREDFKEAQKIISEYNTRLSGEVSYPEEVRQIARDFLKEISDKPNLSLLTSRLGEGRPPQDIKVVEEILESLDKEKVAQELVEVFTVDDRATRISSLRILSKLGRSSIGALSDLLSDIGSFTREEGTQLLVDKHWYEVRNAIYVLGNIPDPSSVQVLAKLNSDPDGRVKLEVLRALEKIGTEESVDALLSFLKDADDQVRKNAITTLSAIGNRRCLDSLVDHFHGNRKDKVFTLTAMGKIGGAEVIDLLLKLLSEKEPVIRRLSSREKEEIKITALNILGKIGSAVSSQVEITRAAEELEKLIAQRKKGIKGLFVKDPVAQRAERVLRMIGGGTLASTLPAATGEK
jgi:Ca2+-binding EF-hand superfamily protein